VLAVMNNQLTKHQKSGSLPSFGQLFLPVGDNLTCST
jgi:hypothetical protein